jgi:hypothetical protein
LFRLRLFQYLSRLLLVLVPPFPPQDREKKKQKITNDQTKDRLLLLVLHTGDFFIFFFILLAVLSFGLSFSSLFFWTFLIIIFSFQRHDKQTDNEASVPTEGQERRERERETLYPVFVRMANAKERKDSSPSPSSI